MQIDVFCQVIDNYGDAGFCLRLSRDLAARHYQVRMFCSDLSIARAINNHPSNFKLLSFSELDKYTALHTDLALCGFAWRPPAQISAELIRHDVPCILIDYLSCEAWINECHGRPSPSMDHLRSWFFFPGLTPASGGVIIEKYWYTLPKNSCKRSNCRRVTVFSYENEHVADILHMLSNSRITSQVLIMGKRSADNLSSLLHMKISATQKTHISNLSLEYKTMVRQDEYDAILRDSDLNLVRGEDSLVRAMLAGRPFLWQPYPQSQELHLKKLECYLKLIGSICKIDPDFFKIYRNLCLEYNSLHRNRKNIFSTLNYDIIEPQFADFSQRLQNYLLSQRSLTDRLLDFCLPRLRTDKSAHKPWYN